MGKMCEDRCEMPEPEAVVTAAEQKAVQAALEALLKAWADAKASIDAGKWPKSDAIEKARKALLKALASGVLGQKLAKLQAFLRSGLVEIMAALATPGAALKPLFEKHGDALDEAWKEFEDAVGVKRDGKFWEASV